MNTEKRKSPLSIDDEKSLLEQHTVEQRVYVIVRDDGELVAATLDWILAIEVCEDLNNRQTDHMFSLKAIPLLEFQGK